MGENKQFGQRAHLQTGLYFQNLCVLISLKAQKCCIQSNQHQLFTGGRITTDNARITTDDASSECSCTGLHLSFTHLFQGNLFDFLRLTGWRGSKVLYFGDHLYSDLAVSFKASIKYYFFTILSVVKFGKGPNIYLYDIKFKHS